MTKRNFARVVSGLALACGMLAGTPALAQQTPAASGEEIVVTARRVEEKLQDVPISITVFNQEQLSNRNIVNSTDLGAYTPSLSVNAKYGPEKASFAIRGFSQDLNTLPTVGVYFADVVAPRLSSNITSGNGAGVGSMFDLQDVQVLKGPQGTLFGRNTTGGAILLVPKKPTDRFEGYVEGTIGDYNARRIEAVLNVPLSDTFKVRLGIDRNQRDGYVHNLSGVGPSLFNDVNYFAARLSVLADLTPDLQNYTVFTYSKSDTTGTLGKYAYCNRGTVANSDGNKSTALLSRAQNCAELDRETAAGYGYYDVANTDPNPFVQGRQWQVINTTTWRASNTLTVKNIASYGEAKERYSFNLSGDFITKPFVVVNPGPNRPQGHQWSLTEELQLQGRTSDDRLTWQAGGYLERSAPLGGQEQYTAILASCGSVANIYSFTCVPGSISVARNTYRYHNYGLYTQASFKLTDTLTVTAGIRNTWDWQREIADNISITPFPSGPLGFKCSRVYLPDGKTLITGDSQLLSNGTCTRTFTISSSRPTWLIDLEYKPNHDMLVYAKYSRGYRGGGINEANFGAETWNPEHVDSYELGLKTSFHGAVRGSFNLTGFWNEFRDQQASVFIPQCVPLPLAGGRADCTSPAPTGINGIENIGKSRLKGIEADGSVFLGESFRFDFGYAYLDAKVTGGTVPFCDNAHFECAQAAFLSPGTVLPFAPKNRITVTGTYTLPMDKKLGRIDVSATFTHTDEQYTNHNNDLAFALGAIPYNSSIDPATDLLNLNLNWRGVAGSPVDLALFATNVTNQHYYVANGGGLSSTGAEFLILGQPRMFGARVKVKFGS